MRSLSRHSAAAWRGVDQPQRSHVSGDFINVVSNGFSNNVAVELQFCVIDGDSSTLLTFDSLHRPTDSLLSLATISSVAGVYLLHSATLVLALWIVAEYPGYVRWPSTFAAGGERWWELADGWESTTILLCFGTQLCTTAMVYSFGGQHRRAVFYNVPLCVCWMAFMLGLGFLLLFPFTSTQPPTVVHAVFHIASIAFNSPSTQSPVWLAYQEAGNPSSEGMPVVLRMQLAAVIGGGSVAVILWEKLVMVWWQRR